VELIGYITRTISIKHIDNKGLFVIQTIMLLVAPAVMAAACYMAFGRIVLWVVPTQFQTMRYLWMPARRITLLFVTCDVLSFAIQSIGGGIDASADTTAKMNKGKNIILAGLGLQLFTFGFFVIASIRFTVVLRTKLKNESLPQETNWQLFLSIVNLASITILIRSVYRFISFVLGVQNTLADHEVFFYCLDALLIFIVVLAYICIHPGMYLPYLGLRRNKEEFSKNVRRGLFSGLARGKGADSIPLSPTKPGQDLETVMP
jgi:hypothetical protein